MPIHDDEALLNANVSPAVRSLILETALPWSKTRQWPIWQFVEERMEARGISSEAAEKALRQMPRCDIGGVGASYGYTRGFSPRGMPLEDEPVVLTVAAALVEPDLMPILADPFLKVLHFMIKRYKETPADPSTPKDVRITSRDLMAAMPELMSDAAIHDSIAGILEAEPVTWSGSSGVEAHGFWWKQVTREVLKYSDVFTVRDYVDRTIEQLHKHRAPLVRESAAELMTQLRESATEVVRDHAMVTPVPASSVTPAPPPPSYIDAGLIDDLEKAGAESTWDVKKLVAILRELNSNHAAGNPLSSLALVRAIMDHIPPVFDKDFYSEVANNYSWSKTDKDHAKSLLPYRPAGDDVMHRQISKEKDLLAMGDLPPRTGLNAVLRGVLVLLKKDAAAATRKP